MIPVSVRQHDSLDRAEIDAEALAVMFHRIIDRPGIEQHHSLALARERADHQRQPVIGAAQARHRRHAACPCEPVPAIRG